MPAAGPDFQAEGNKIKAGRNEIQIRRNEIQIRRNKIQMPFPSTNACFSMGYPSFRQAPTPCGRLLAVPAPDIRAGSTLGSFAGVGFLKN
jgi:hypothetical protein